MSASRVPMMFRSLYGLCKNTLPVGNAMTPNTQGAKLVTTFADVTAQRQALEKSRRSRD